ncbi:MAG: SxtJ family membrane protein [Nitrospinales bacterium]
MKPAEAFRQLEENQKKTLKSFGLLMGGVFSLIGMGLAYKGIKAVSIFPGAIALGFVATSLTAPSKLAWIHKMWMKFAEALGAFNAKLILGFIYLALFSLVRFVFFMIGKDPMKRKFDTDAKSYWKDHETTGNDPKRYEKQY